MKTLVKTISVLRGKRALWRIIAAIALVLGVPVASFAQNVVYKNSGALTGSLANTLQGDLQVANGRTLTFGSVGTLVLGTGSTLSLSGATVTGSFSLSGVTLDSPTITNAATISTSGTVTLRGTSSATSFSATTATISTATISASTVTTETVSTASISTASLSTLTIGNTLRAISPTGGIGYGAGSGTASTQLTSKSTAVTANGLTGQITLNSYSMSAGTTASFVVTNSAVASTDVIMTNINSASYSARAFAGTGTALFTIHNQSAVTASDAAVINFAIIRGSAN
jgi:hypothetical protein